MARFSSRKAGLIQNFNRRTKKYSPKSLFDISALECFEKISWMNNGFAKLLTYNLECLPVTVQKKLSTHLTDMWTYYKTFFYFDLFECSEHFDIRSGIVLPCCQTFLTKISTAELGNFKFRKYKFKIYLHTTYSVLHYACKNCFQYLKSSSNVRYTLVESRQYYNKESKSSKIIEYTQRSYCTICKIGSFSFSDLNFTNVSNSTFSINSTETGSDDESYYNLDMTSSEDDD